MRWFNNDAYMSGFMPSSAASVTANPAIFAEMNLVLADYHSTRNELRAAELNLDAATLGLLMINPSQTYEISKILISLIDAKIARQDIVGATELSLIVNEFILKSLTQGSPLQAQYHIILGTLFSFGTLHSSTASVLSNAAVLMQNLEINEEIKIHQVGDSDRAGDGGPRSRQQIV